MQNISYNYRIVLNRLLPVLIVPVILVVSATLVHATITIDWKTGSEGVNTSQDHDNNNLYQWKSARLQTDEPQQANLAFKSTMKEGGLDIIEFTPTESEIESTWNGTETELDTKYGKWVISSRNALSCSMTSCYEIEFRQNVSAIDGLEGFNVTIKLVVERTGSVTESNSLTYLINGRSKVSIEITSGNLEYFSEANADAYDEIMGEVTYFHPKNTGIVTGTYVQNEDQSTPVFSDRRAIDHDIVGYRASGVNFNFGIWYLAFPVTSLTTDEHNSNYQTIVRKLIFRPNTDKINKIPPGGVATSVLSARIVTLSPQTIIYDGRITVEVIGRNDIKMDWQSTSTGMETNLSNNYDTVRSHYADLQANIENESALTFELWIKEGSDEIEKDNLTKGDVYSIWAGSEWHIYTTYGQWYVQSFSKCAPQADFSKCSKVLFEPNRAKVNSLYGKNVTIWLRGTRTVEDVSEIATLKFEIIGHPLSSLSWKAESPITIETLDQLESNTFSGVGWIFKSKTNSISVNASENFNQSTQSISGIIGATSTVNNFMARQYGTDLVYGSWFIEENFSGQDDSHNSNYHSGTLQFLFKANPAEISKILNSNTIVISTLEVNIHQEDNSSQIMQTNSISVTINPTAARPTLSIVSKSSSVVEGQVATFTIISDRNPEQPMSVSFTPTNSKGEFLKPTTHLTGITKIESLTFNQESDSEIWTDIISIDLRGVDGKDTEDGSITVNLDAVSEHSVYVVAKEPNNSATIVVEDAEAPALSFAESLISVTEEDIDKYIQLTLNLSESIDNAVDVSYEIINESATGGDDFVDIANGSVSFLPNTTSIPINFQIKGDELSEGDETFKVIISTPPSNAYFRHGVSTLEARVTIVDDEPIIMSVATTDFKVAEDVINGNFIVDVVLSKTALIANPNTPIPEPVSFLVETSSGTATIDADFKTPDRQPTQPRFRIPASAKTFSFAIPILNDVENEGNETFSVRIHDLQQATFADGSRQQALKLTIIDNEKPTLSFMQNTKTVEEEDADTNVELTLNLSGPIKEAVDISYEIIAETAIADTDFVDNGNGVVTITANTTSIPISIQIKGDDINEGNETLKVRVTTPSSNVVFTEGDSMLEATITIIDDESPTLSVDSLTLTISERAEMTHIGLTLSGPTNEDVVVTFSTSITGSDTAQQGDFTAQTASTTTISDSSSPATSGLIQIPINNDTDEEENETFTLTLTEISGAVFANDQSSIVVKVTIIDDEGLPTLSIASTPIAVNEQSGYAEIGLSFTPAIIEPVMIVYSTIQGTAVGGVDYTIQTNATAEITTGNKETIYIPITNDKIYEGEEKFFIEISIIQGAAYGSDVINTPIMITITDNETEPTLTISAYSCEYSESIPTNFSVNESVGNLIFNAKLSHPSQNPVTFNYSATADTATSADFYVRSATQYTIQPGTLCTEIVSPITHDILFEEDEQFNVTFTRDTGTNIIPPFKVKIEDDDVAIWSIEDLAMNEGDSDAEMAFRVYLSTPVYQTVRAKWTASTIAGNTATFGEDYAPNHNSYTGYVTVLAGRVEGSIVGLEITGDTIFEPDETFTITLSDPEEGTQIGDGEAIGTIINDDPEPILSVSTITQDSGN